MTLILLLYVYILFGSPNVPYSESRLKKYCY
jgi:hypothetical protein